MPETEPKPKPILFLSDDPSSTTGLGRITRDLATMVATHMPDEFRVATLGYGGPGCRHLPFQQYRIHSIDGWLVPELPSVWDDFCAGERGILMTIWDPSRLRWLSRPDATDHKDQPLCDPRLRRWVKSRPFELWGYIPVDASGPNGKLTVKIGDTLRGYDRLIAYSEWAARIIENTLQPGMHGRDSLDGVPVPSLPHGIDTSVWRPTPRRDAKALFRQMGFDGLTDNSFLVGMVATNQPRKDFGLGFEVCAKLMQQGLDVRVWVHTDTLVRHWNLLALIEDFGLLTRCVCTMDRYPDATMAVLYSACDVTLGIGLGEGFGYPIFESLACETPCVHGDYGGAAEWLTEASKPAPTAWRLDGQFNCVRPVFDTDRWVESCYRVADPGQANPEPFITELPPALDWNALWPRWAEWFRGGLR